MTCAACAARIEKSLNKMPGVVANVNFAAESAQVTLQPEQSSAAAVVETIRRTGYSVPVRVAEFQIYGMTCVACATRIEKALNKHRGRGGDGQFRQRDRPHPLRARADHGRTADRGRSARPGTRRASASRRTPLRKRRAATDAYRAELRLFWISVALSLPLLVEMFSMFGQAHANCCRAGCSSRSPRRCSSGSAGASTSAATRPCAAAAPTWTCWWRWARRMAYGLSAPS